MAEGWGDPVDLDQSSSSERGWGPPIGEPKPAPKPTDISGPMPGPIDALTAGFKRSISDIGQSAETLEGKTPTQVAPDTSPAAEGFGWRDLLEPSRGLSKLAYQTGASSPTIVGGGLGGIGGFLAAGPIGTAIGGAGGAAIGAALQTIGPSFARELKKNPQDPDGAWNRAVASSLVSGAASGASWAAFPIGSRFFQGPLKYLAFQALGVQPGINVAEKVAQNVITGDQPTGGLGEAYTSGVVGTAVPAVGHIALRGKFGEPESIPEALTPAESAARAADLRSQAQNHILQAAASTQPNIARKFLGKADDLNQAADWEEARHTLPQQITASLAQADQLEQQSKNPALPLTQSYALKAQADALREQARFNSLVVNIPPPLQQRGRISTSYLNNIDPESTSEAALKAGSVVAQYNSQKAQLRDSLFRMGADTYRYKWTPVPWDDQRRFITAYESGLALPNDLRTKYPWMDQAYRDYRQQFQLDYQNEVQMGSKAHYLENYFPHMWKDVQAAQMLFKPENLIQSMGQTWFQKARTYDLMELGEAHGLEPAYKNVQDIVTARRLASADMINKMEMLHNLQDRGVAIPYNDAPAHIKNPKITGSPVQWQPVNAPDRQQWLIAPDAQALWKNGIEAQGLWQNPTYIGDAFRGWMKMKSAWVPLKLGLSLFHPNHVMHIMGVNNISRALRETFGPGQQGLYRRFVSLPEAMLQSVGDLIFASTPYAPFLGKDMTKAWATPKEWQTPQQAAQVKLMNEAGTSAQLSEELRMHAEKGFREALANSKYLKAIPYGALRGYEKTIGAIFEKWIPSLKMAALQREADSLFRRRPDLLSDDVNRKVALRALGKQIDNRFGEMFYGNLFWNRTLKDASIASFLSLGWNLGFAREFGGGFFEPIVRRMIDAPNPTRKLVRDVTSKTTNMWVYGLTAATINGLMTKGLSGQDPEGLDYIFPRIGGLNPDGSPRRITNAFYTREVPMAMKHIEEQGGGFEGTVNGLKEMLYNKMMFSPFAELWNNKDYFGYSIRDENSPAYQQLYQMGKHLVGDQLSPMSITGAKRALELSGKPHEGLTLQNVEFNKQFPYAHFSGFPYLTSDVFKQIADRDVTLPLLGFGPAPGYASKSALDNRIQHLFKETVVPERKSFDVAARAKERSEARTAYIGAQQRKDPTAIQAAAQKLAELGQTTKEINKIQPGAPTDYMFQRLQKLDQISLMKTMTPEEFKHYYPIFFGKGKSKSKLIYDPDINALAQKYYKQPSGGGGWGPPQ